MSRRLTEALANARLDDFSRRQLIAGGAMAPFANTRLTAIDPAHAACGDWLARHAERISLIARWQTLESRLAREHNWLRLTLRQRARLPQAEELDAIDDRLDVLGEENARLLAGLPALKAITGPGIAAKLKVAMVEVRPEENEDAHNLIASIARDFRALARSGSP
jgi:hypothetical protein